MNRTLKVLLEPFVPTWVGPMKGSILRYRKIFRRWPNLIVPRTFNEHVLHRMLFDRDPRLTLFSDKFRVRDFVRERLGDGARNYLTELYAVTHSPNEICGLDLPRRFVMKANHSSGQSRLVQDFRDEQCGELEQLAEEWLATNFYLDAFEWGYLNIKRCVIFEELLGADAIVPDDYKFFCYQGEPRFLQVDRNRYTAHQRNFYDMTFRLLPVTQECENFSSDHGPPANFDRMLEISRTLARGMDFLRVDLYNIEGRIVFGELTCYPGGGLVPFVPDSWDLEFGRYWR